MAQIRFFSVGKNTHIQLYLPMLLGRKILRALGQVFDLHLSPYYYLLH